MEAPVDTGRSGWRVHENLSGRILVVDDSPHDRELIEQFLAPEGYAIEAVESGPAALLKLESGAPDLVLLDVAMPGMDGFEVCSRIRATRTGAELPIVFLSGVTDLGSHQRAMASGADDFLNKPINRTELLLRLRSLLWIRRLKKELSDGYDLIRTQRDALLTAQRQSEELTSLVVHDLKGPLSTMLMNAGSLVESGAGGDIDSARQIVSAALAMNRMVSNLLDISHSEHGELKPVFTDVDLAALAAELVRAQAVRDPRQPLDLQAAKVTIEADAELLRRILENLIDNARKYSQSQEPIRIEIELVDPQWVELRVRDSGPGVPLALREKIFEKYARLEEGADQHLDTSRGLGLTFCRLAAQAHHGRIWVDDNQPRGSVFHVRMPVSRDVVK